MRTHNHIEVHFNRLLPCCYNHGNVKRMNQINAERHLFENLPVRNRKIFVDDVLRPTDAPEDYPNNRQGPNDSNIHKQHRIEGDEVFVKD